MTERDYFEDFGSDDSITYEDAREVLERVLPEYGAHLVFVGPHVSAYGKTDEYSYWSDRYGYGQSCLLTLPRTKAEFEHLVRRDLETALR